MSKHRVIVLKIVAKQLTVTDATRESGLSRRKIYRLLARYKQEGLEAVEPRSRKPRSNPAATPEIVRARTLSLRQKLTGEGRDAGPVTIVWHLEQEGYRPPSTSTIHRILHKAGLIIPEPQKTPAHFLHSL